MSGCLAFLRSKVLASHMSGQLDSDAQLSVKVDCVFMFC